MRTEVEFQSEGATLRGWLYSPDDASNVPRPAVIMAHGFSATRHMTTDKYASVLFDARFTVLLYDHRNFGASDGEPRQQINPWVQARGYRDAISYLLARDDIHPEGIAIWGDSLSGGVALAVAAVDKRVAALLAQVPACGPEPPPDDPDGRKFRAMADTIVSGNVQPSPNDVQGPMPVVSDDQVRRPSVLPPLTAYRWFIEYGGRLGTQWVNDVTRAQPRTSEPWHPGLCAAHVTCPAIFLVSQADEMRNAAPTVSRTAFDRLRGPKQWVDLDGGHFGLLYYPSEEFDRASSAQARFLKEHLGHLCK
jgi:pimeloyl-ACP methyl ester carboxylesterase